MHQQRSNFPRRRIVALGVIALLAGLFLTNAVRGNEIADPAQRASQLIIKFKPTAASSQRGKLTTDLSQQLDEIAGVSLRYFRDMASGAKVMRLPTEMPIEQVEEVAKRIAANHQVEFAEPDYRMFPMLVPSDPGYGAQWHLNDLLGGINAPAAWDITTGSTATVVAVLDTGITNHPDLQTRMLPGYDFVTDVLRANDSDGRDDDPSDPGDWINAADKATSQFSDCTIRTSSWHGTMVSGAIGAIANNGLRGVGIDWAAQLLPVRVLGKCGGLTSDITDGMLWAAGISVSGVPDNANPAKVINMSLGSKGSCPNAYQAAVTQIVNAGKIIVTSAGNDNSADDHRPASCSGVISVAAIGRSGARASYSNFGSKVTITAPGGDGGDFITTGNTGTTTPNQANTVGTSGTSFAAPVVAGVVSLMLAVRPTLDAPTVTRLLRASARPFPDSTCTTSICGAGIVDAAAAVRLTRDLNYGVATFVSFADTDTNQPNADLLLRVSNYGASGAANVGAAVTTGNSDFTVAGSNCLSPLGSGTSCDVFLRFNPAASGLRTGQLNVSVGAANYTVSLAGYGYLAGEFVQKSVGANSNSSPVYLTRASDGQFWYTIESRNSVGRLSTDGVVTEWIMPTASSGPFDIAQGGDGNLWVTQLDGNRIGRITPTGSITEFVVPTAGSQPRGITAGPDGNMWFTQITGARIARITPAGAITEFVIPWAAAAPRGIATGPDGNLWFTDSGARVIGRLTPAGVFTSFTIPWASENARAIAAGADGNMWFTELGSNRLGRISMSGAMTPFALPRDGAGPLGITRGADGAMWYAASSSSRIGRIDTSTGQISEYRLPVSGSSPTGIAAGPNNSIWTAASGRNSIVALALDGNNGLVASNAKRGIIDIDGNGRSELLLRNGSTQLLAGRLVNNSFAFKPMADPGSNFRLLGAGDFNANGRTDLAFQNMVQDATFGDVRAWSDFNTGNEVLWRQVKKVWDVQAIGDLDGDGFVDLVWRYVVSDSPDTGVSYVWFSKGDGVSQVRKRGGAPLNWTLLGAADLDQNGAADMIYINPDAQIRALMATPNRTCANLSAGSLPGGATALKVADFTGRGRGDILVRNSTTGTVQLVSLNGSGLSLPPYTGAPDDQNASCTASTLTVAQTTINLPSIDTTWQFYASGDFNGDGVVDIVWRQPSGVLTVWLMNANGVTPRVISNAGTAPANSAPVNLQ
jgi:streptogramin lyase